MAMHARRRAWIQLAWNAIACLLLLIVAERALAQGAPMIESADVREADSHIDLIVQFSCSMRYVTHDPSSTGSMVRVRLIPGPDCSSDANAPFALERPPIADREVLKSLLLEQVFAGELALTIEWAREEHFVLAPSADLRGLRVRLLRPGKPEASRVMIADSLPESAAYAINLDSTTHPFDEQTQAAARTMFGTEPYDSIVKFDGQTWHRLRVGPFASRPEAERALALAKTRFARAWLAIADEQRETNTTDITSPVAPTRTNPKAAHLSQSELDVLVQQARKALQKRDYESAITLFTKAVEQPEFPARADALEFLGVARERNRQLAHAKAEYEEYLRAYPRSSSAPRVRQRLGTLLAAHRPGADRNAGEEAARQWRVYGGAGLRYQYDTSRLQTGDEKQSFIAQHAAITDVDIVSRKHGERFDFLSRLSAGYQKDLLNNGPGDRTRIGITYAEVSDQDWHWSARLGRQSRTSAGVLGSFDGLSLGYQFLPRMRANAIYGYPVDSSYQSLQRGRTLTGLSFDFGSFAQSWVFSLYATRQSDQSLTDRQAIGTEVRYFHPGRSVIGLVDYDTLYSTINTVVLLGVMELPTRWTVSFDVDRRNSPVLTTRNALIGQPTEDLTTLTTLFTEDQIRQLAKDRTARADTYSVAITKSLTDALRLSVDASSTSITATPESCGVTAIPTSGNVQSYAVQLLGGGWIARDDFNVVGVRYQTGGDSKITSLAYYTRFSMGTAWRIGPRIRVDQQERSIDGSKRLLYIPSLRTDYLGKHLSLLTELGAELGSRTGSAQRENSSDYFVSVQGRWNF